jgi:hypothetical protein
LNSSEKADREENDSQSGGALDSFMNPQAVERRVWRNLFIVVALVILSAAIFAPLTIFLGLSLGGLLALLNFKWLHTSVRDILSEGSNKAPPGTMILFIVRWIVVGAAIYGAHLTGYFDSVAMLSGLFAPALAVMIEAGYVTYKTITHSGERD